MERATFAAYLLFQWSRRRRACYVPHCMYAVLVDVEFVKSSMRSCAEVWRQQCFGFVCGVCPRMSSHARIRFIIILHNLQLSLQTSRSFLDYPIIAIHAPLYIPCDLFSQPRRFLLDLLLCPRLSLLVLRPLSSLSLLSLFLMSSHVSFFTLQPLVHLISLARIAFSPRYHMAMHMRHTLTRRSTILHSDVECFGFVNPLEGMLYAGHGVEEVAYFFGCQV